MALNRLNPFGLPDAIVCDIDGTLCDVRSIRHLVERPRRGPNGGQDFERFHSESINSPAHQEVVGVLHRARASGLKVIVVSGREARWSFLTSTWLDEHSVEYDELLMRETRDSRPDAVVKAEIAGRIARRYHARIAVDDRADIIDVWQRAGMATVLVAPDGSMAKAVWPSGLVVSELQDIISPPASSSLV